MNFHDTRSWEQKQHEILNKRIACSACGGMTWGYELDSAGCCKAKACQAPTEAKRAENKAPVIQLVPREEVSPTPDKEQLAA